MLDTIVVGRRLSGSLCALELRMRGLSVALFEYAADGERLERMARIPRTVLNDEPISGEAFAERLMRRMKQLNVVVGDDWVSEIHADAHRAATAIAGCAQLERADKKTTARPST